MANSQSREETDTRTIPTPAPPLTVCDGHGGVALSLGLAGFAWWDPTQADSGIRLTAFHGEWPTLYALEMENNSFVLAGRDSRLRLVRLTSDRRELELVCDWEAEGIPTGLAYRSGILVVAAAGAGISIWDWPDLLNAPRLVGRYPFVSYAKKVNFIDKHRVVVADSDTGGAWIIDVTDLMRPKREAFLEVTAYCDSVASLENGALISDRMKGVSIARNRNEKWVIEGTIKAMNPESEEGYVQSVRVTRFGRVVICEGRSGLRVFQLNEDGSTLGPLGVFNTPGQVLDAVEYESGKFAVADFGAGLTLLSIK